MDFTFIQQISIIFGILGYVVGIIGTIYGIKKKRELSKLQSKSEKARASAYRAKKKAEDARKAKYVVDAVKAFWELITGKKTNSTERL